MNMNKALQHLYKAVSGNDTSKVNISKLLVDIHYAMTGVVSPVKNNWARIIDSIATNWSGGGGSSEFTTAEVTITNNASDSVSFDLSLAITMSAEGISTTLGGMSSTQIGSGMVANAVLYKGTAFMELKSWDEYDFNIVASGDAQVMGYNCLITGDCTITIS